MSGIYLVRILDPEFRKVDISNCYSKDGWKVLLIATILLFIRIYIVALFPDRS